MRVLSTAAAFIKILPSSKNNTHNLKSPQGWRVFQDSSGHVLIRGLGSFDLLNMVPDIKEQDPEKIQPWIPSSPLHKVHMHLGLLVLEHPHEAAEFQKQPWHKNED